MGSCISVHKGSQASAMKVGLSFGSNTNNLITPISPVEEKPVANGDYTLKSQSPSTFNDVGNEEETFFDSRPWLDSDCEDDFLSVNGDFTPSRGNSPVHHNFSVGAPPDNNGTDVGSLRPVSETSSTGKKKMLVDFFEESIQEDKDANALNTSSCQSIGNGKMIAKPTIKDVFPPKSADATSFVSGTNSLCSSERTANGDNPMFKKPIRSMQCCLPSLVSCSSLSERKKKMNPSIL